MKVGTKSVLFGAHCFFLHPWFVAWAWCRLYGFPWDPRLWVAFFVHDLGYWGKPNMDGEEGEKHPVWGANLMGWLFDRTRTVIGWEYREWSHGDKGVPWRVNLGFEKMRLEGWRIVAISQTFTLLEKPLFKETWQQFTLYHSRFLAKKHGRPCSRLCVADKLAIVLTPSWVYLPMAIATGEIHEYRSKAKRMNPGSGAEYATTHREWHVSMKDYVLRWVDAHKNGAEDTWTSPNRNVKDDHGVYH